MSGLSSGKLSCYLCSQYFEKDRDLALHRFYFHDEVPFLCQISGCRLSFWKKSGLIAHRITIHKTRAPISCRLCSETFKSFKLKQRHCKKVHSKQVDRRTMLKMFVCDYCNKNFCSEATLKTHMVVHSDIKNYSCHICGKTFKLKLTLSKHLRFHFKNSSTFDNEEKVLERSTLIIDSSKANNNEIMESDLISQTSVPGDKTGEFILNHQEKDVVVSNQDISTVLNIEDQEPSAVSSSENDVLGIGGSKLFNICMVFKCPECDKLFINKERLYEHIILVHSETGPIQFELNNVLRLNVESGGEENNFL